MKLLLSCLLLTLLFSVEAQTPQVSHYVIHSDHANYDQGLLQMEGVDTHFDVYTSQKRRRAQKLEISKFIDKVYQGHIARLSVPNQSYLLTIEKLRYNPYNHRLTLELSGAPFADKTRFERPTVTFY